MTEEVVGVDVEVGEDIEELGDEEGEGPEQDKTSIFSIDSSLQVS